MASRATNFRQKTVGWVGLQGLLLFAPGLDAAELTLATRGEPTNAVIATSASRVATATAEDGHSLRVGTVVQTTWSDGRVTTEPGAGGYTELAAGLNCRDSQGRWLRADTEPSLQPDGALVYDRLALAFRFAPGADAAAVVEARRDGRVIARSAVAGLAYYDRASRLSHVFAWVKNAPAQPYDQGVFYADAFVGAQADIRYQLDPAKLQQDLVIYGLPDPALFGLDPESTWLSALTELNDVNLAQADVCRDGAAQAEVVSEAPLEVFKQGAEGWDRAFNFQRSYAYAEAGDWVMGGASRADEAPLAMRLVEAQNRVFLSEEVPFRDVAAKTPSAVLAYWPDHAEPPRRLATVPPIRGLEGGNLLPPPRHARRLSPAGRFVIDYVDYYGTVTNGVRFKTGQTYFISSDLALSGAKLTIEPGCFVKLATNAQILLQSGATLENLTHAGNPALFTTVFDTNNAGQAVSGYTGNPATNRFKTALSISSPTQTIEGLSVRYAKVGLSFAATAGSTQAVRNTQFADCDRAVEVQAGTGSVRVVNCLVKNAREGVWAKTNQVQVHACTFDGLTNWAVAVTSGVSALDVRCTLFANIAGKNLQSNAAAVVSFSSNATYLAGTDFVGSVVSPTGTLFLVGSQGSNYIAQGSGLVDAGDAAATDSRYLLHHFTTATNHLKETNSTVDIGFHYPSPADADGDGLPDALEDRWGDGAYGAGDYASWTNGDTDGEGLLDGEELTYGTNPQAQDTDGDGQTDQQELGCGSDPLNSNSVISAISGVVTYSGGQTGTIRVTTDYEPGLVLYYPFSASNAATVSDFSGMNHTAAVLNGVQWITNGYSGGAYQFDGSNDRLNAGKPPGLTAQITNQFTLACWINPSNDHEGYIVGRARSSYNDLSLYINDPMNQGINYTLKRQGGPEHFLESKAGGWSNIPNLTWTHVASTFDGTQFLGFINGQVVASSNISGIVGNNGNDFMVGDRHTLDRRFRGKIDEVKVYNRGLGTGEVYTLFTGGVANLSRIAATIVSPTNYSLTNAPNRRAYAVSAWRDSNGNTNRESAEAWGSYTGNPVLVTAAVSGVDIVLSDPDTDGDGMPDWWEVLYGLNPTSSVPGASEGWWRFDEGVGTNITNSASTAYSGVVVNGGLWTNGALGGALWFDGSDDYVRIPQNPAIVLGTQVTAAGWMYYDDSAASTFQSLISDMTNCGGGYSGFWTGFDPTYAPGLAALWGGYCGDFHYPSLNTNIAGRWVHYAFTQDGAVGRIYVDGREIASESGLFTHAHQSDLLIGWAHDTDPGYSYFWKGRLDDVRLFKTALSSNAICTMYDARQDPDGDGLDNLGEYLAGSDPQNADPTSPAVTMTRPVAGEQTTLIP